jgi:hypothetical protein
VNAELGVLIELQAVDVEVARLNAEISYLPKHLAEIEVKLQTHIQQLESDRKVLAAHLKQRKGFEDEVKIIREKISKYRDQMLGVKTNEQYRAFQHEIDYAEKEISTFEDKILQTMVSDDDLNGAVKKAEAALAAEKKVVEKEKAEVTARTAEDQKQLAGRNQRREELKAAISADTYKRYEWIRERKKTAIAEARDGYCTGCRVLLRPQLYNEVRAKDVILACEGCGRLLYFLPPPTAQPTPEELGAHLS